MRPLFANSDLRARWQDYRPTKAQTFWIAAGCVAATLILGFGAGGWVTGGTAQNMVSQATADARLQLAAAVCVEDFMQAANASGRLQKLKDIAWYQRADLIVDGGWATMPDKTEPNSTVAYSCAEKLVGLQAVAPGAVTQTSTVLAK
jgi:hypothetical protein